MALTETSIVNMALSKFGERPLTALATDDTKPAIHARIHYEPTRDALLRSHWWRFASTRIALAADWVTATAYTTDQYVWSSSMLYKCAVAHTSTTAGAHDAANATDWTLVTARPPYEWEYQYDLPADFVRMRDNYCEFDGYAIEGLKLLTDETEVLLQYVKQVTDPTQFDPMFVKVLAQQLAIELVLPIAGDKTMQDRLIMQLSPLLAQARLVNLQEQDNAAPYQTWNDARDA